MPLFRDPSSTPREIDIYSWGLFWRKFNSEQHLFEAFFHVTRTFGSVEPYIECGNWHPNGKYRVQPFSDVTMLCAYRIEQTLLYNNLDLS